MEKQIQKSKTTPKFELNFISFAQSKINLMLLTISAIVITLSSCQKEGPEGPQGIPGNANVKSMNFSLDSNSWQKVGTVHYSDVIVAILTQNVFEKGSINVYMESPTQPGIWYNMPYSILIDSSSTNVLTFGYSFWTGKVRINKIDSQMPTKPKQVLKFRISVTEGPSN